MVTPIEDHISSQGEKVLQDKGMPGVPQDYSPKGGKREMIKAHYMMKVLQNVEGEEIDARHPDYGQDQNIGLHILNPRFMILTIFTDDCLSSYNKNKYLHILHLKP